MNLSIISADQAFASTLQKSLLSKITSTVIIASKLSANEIITKVPDTEILIASPSGIAHVSKELFTGLPKLKYISTVSIGTDFVDLAAAKEANIIVSNLKGVNEESVAEHLWGMILDLSKRITETDRTMREKKSYKQTDFTGKEIFGKTLGIIGLGNIGQKVAGIAQGFEMKVIGINEKGREVRNVQLVDFATLLKVSDIIAVTVPLTAETENMIADEEFSHMKDGVILVSTSREKIINKEATVHALESGKLFGFGMDADIMEGEMTESYVRFANVIVTPHTASVTESSNERYVTMTVENIQAFLDGKPKRVVV